MKLAPKLIFLAEILGVFLFSLEECGDERYFYYHCVYKMPGHLPGHFGDNMV